MFSTLEKDLLFLAGASVYRDVHEGFHPCLDQSSRDELPWATVSPKLAPIFQKAGSYGTAPVSVE
jgi:hypothetical protein